MRYSTYSLSRLAFLLVFAVGAAGVLVNRLVPVEAPEYTIDFAQPWAVGKHLFVYQKGHNLILDTATGRPVDFKTGQGREFDLISFSPFQTRGGQRQVMARQQVMTNEGIELTPGKIELVRLDYPSGQVQDSRELDWLPNSPGAWDIEPQRGLSGLFTTAAGHLMRLDWTDAHGRATRHPGQRVQWAVEPPFGVHTFLAEPSWVASGEGGAANRLLASIWGLDPETKRFHTGLAWLELDHERSQIVDYGFLINEDLGREKNRLNMRYPVARADDKGQLQALWYEKRQGEKAWALKHARLQVVVGSDGSLDYRLGTSHELARGCMATLPGFGPGLGSVYYVVAPEASARYDTVSWRKLNLQAGRELLVATGKHAGR
ncbi:MAG: hypothetical protein ACKO0V_23955 [bacterium]